MKLSRWTANQGRRLFIQRLIEPRHANAAQLQNIAKTFGGHQRGARAFAFENRVRRHGGCVQHFRSLDTGGRAIPRDLLNAGQNGFGVVVRRRRNLAGQQLARLIARSGLSADDAARRVDAQMPAADKARLANHVIDTSGSFEETDAQVAAVWARLLDAPAGRSKS
jgi:hypothetical protein